MLSLREVEDYAIQFSSVDLTTFHVHQRDVQTKIYEFLKVQFMRREIKTRARGFIISAGDFEASAGVEVCFNEQ